VRAEAGRALERGQRQQGAIVPEVGLTLESYRQAALSAQQPEVADPRVLQAGQALLWSTLQLLRPSK
jgi:hypothetical protein